MLLKLGTKTKLLGKQWNVYIYFYFILTIYFIVTLKKYPIVSFDNQSKLNRQLLLHRSIVYLTSDLIDNDDNLLIINHRNFNNKACLCYMRNRSQSCLFARYRSFCATLNIIKMKKWSKGTIIKQVILIQQVTQEKIINDFNTKKYFKLRRKGDLKF